MSQDPSPLKPTHEFSILKILIPQVIQTGHVLMHINTHTHARTHARTHAHTHAHTHTHTHTHTPELG